MRRRDFLKTVGVATASAALPQRLGAAQERRDRPNIVFVLADDMGVGDLSYLNADSQIPTTNIDRIGREGTYFSDAHSPSALCTPTRYGILTGRYCWRTRVQRGVLWGYSRHLIEPERLTVPSLLKQHGYNTAHIGKWHLGMDMPTTDGQGTRLPHAGADRRAYTADVDWTGTIQNGPRAV
ncbi:MAG: sulfatase-like hydrolase/transferase, partial [Vicinamibacterales bacterium]|nr:sulfatase-like hydrolase/transferase [Vicinamibacterales bacterium]